MVLQSLAKMPPQFTADELMENIIFLSKIEAGLKDIEAGKVHKHEDILDLIVRK